MRDLASPPIPTPSDTTGGKREEHYEHTGDTQLGWVKRYQMKRGNESCCQDSMNHANYIEDVG
jgi:hypothetical protein